MHYNDPFYMGPEQQKSIEDVLKYLYKQDQPKLVQPILDLMRMSENWYGRLDELRKLQEVDKKPEGLV